MPLTKDKEGPGNSIPGYLSKGTQNTNSKIHTHPYVHCSIIYNSQDMKATWVAINSWMDKEVGEMI